MAVLLEFFKHRCVAANWRAFKEAYNDFVTATELIGKDAAIQATTLLSCKSVEGAWLLWPSPMFLNPLENLLKRSIYSNRTIMHTLIERSGILYREYSHIFIIVQFQLSMILHFGVKYLKISNSITWAYRQTHVTDIYFIFLFDCPLV